MYSLGRQGVEYGFVGSTGLSRASARAWRSRRSWSEARVRVIGSCRRWVWVCDCSVAGDDSAGGSESFSDRLSFSVSSSSWASMESVKVVGRESAERIVRLKARSSCFRLAEANVSVERTAFACAISDCSDALTSPGPVVEEDGSAAPASVDVSA